VDQASGLRQLINKHADSIWAERESDKKINSDSQPRAIAVTSGKGGVGKTNVVGNLAIAMSRLGKRVLILDGDLGLANIDILFGIRSTYNIQHVINGQKKLKEIIVKGPEKTLVIPGGSGLQGLANLTQGQRIQLLREFESLNNKIDIFLIDTGAGISKNITYFNMAAQERIVISTPEPTSITDAYALIKVMYKHHGTTSFKLLVNMAANKKEAVSVYNNLETNLSRFLKNIMLEYIGFIPKDEHISKSVRKQQPVVVSYPKSLSGKSFVTLAQNLINPNSNNSKEKNTYFWKKLISNFQL